MKNKSKHSVKDERKKKLAQAETSKVDSKRCFNCGGKNHISAKCPDKEKGVKCFKCEGYGHVAAKCQTETSAKVVEKTKSCNATQSEAKKCYKEIRIDKHRLLALIDTGSDLSLIRADCYAKIGTPKLIDKQVKFHGVGGSENFTLGETCIKFYVDNDLFDITLHVVPDALLQQAVLIGTDFLNRVDVHIKEGIVSIVKVNKQPFVCSDVNKIDVVQDVNEVDLTHVNNPSCKNELKEIISNYKPDKVRDVDIKLNIVLKDDVPVYQRARRLAMSKQKEVDVQIQKWLDNGIIQPSLSDYASPIVLVRKKDGTVRLCVDFRKLNEKVIKTRYPLPNIEDQIDRLKGAKVFSTIDLENGYFHVSVAPDSRKYTEFIVPNGHYEFLRMPFGLSTSPSYFQKYINAIFAELVAKDIVCIYMDDLIIPSVDYQEGIKRLKTVLDVASQYGLTINWKKCQFLQTRVSYLGYIIEKGEVMPSEEKTKAVEHFPIPKNVKAVQSFLGLTGYFRKFIPNYALIARPLTNLLKKDVNFVFGDEEMTAFNRLKKALSEKPILRIYCPNAETELHTDASSQGYGAILLQKDSEDRSLHPIFYASGKTTQAEAKLCSYELEVLAIVKAVRKFRVYLIGIQFKIVTDCKAFTQTMKRADACTRVARWSLFLQDFKYTIEHRPGQSMRHVDALSRNTLPAAMLIDEDQDSITMRLLKNQLEDEDLIVIREQVKNQQTTDFEIKNELLYKKMNGDFLIVVPKLMQNSIIRQAHERGHFGPDKTEKLLKTDYWFKGMRTKIEKVIRNCINCILAEQKAGKQEGWLCPIDKGEMPFQTYHVDHLGPMPSTKKKYCHLFVVIDAFTKFVWIYPTKSTGTAEVLDKLMLQSTTFGNPRRIISDKGTAFTSHDFQEYCTDEKIEHVTVATGVPRGNGQVERVNRTLIPILTKLAAPNAAEWHKYVDRAQRYINNSPNRSTGMTPFYLLFGTRMNIKDDPVIKEILEKEEAMAYQQERDKMRELAREEIIKVQEENKRIYNKRRKKPNKYKQDDLVAIKRTQGGPGLKFATKYLGPYQVKRALRNERYIVEKIGQGEGPRKTSTAADFMKPWRKDATEDYISKEEN